MDNVQRHAEIPLPIRLMVAPFFLSQHYQYIIDIVLGRKPKLVEK